MSTSKRVEHDHFHIDSTGKKTLQLLRIFFKGKLNSKRIASFPRARIAFVGENSRIEWKIVDL